MKTVFCSVVFCGWAFFWGCVSDQCLSHPAEGLVLELPYFTAAIVGTMRYANFPSDASDATLITKVLKDHPEWQEAFSATQIKLRRNGTNAIVLVCSPDGKHAWLEDSDRTPLKIEYKWYLIDTNRPAVFSLDPSIEGK
jgi:hypothetical protein